VKVSDGEFGAWDVDGKVNLRSAREVLDIAIAPVLGTALGDK
jgi:hypothetical protein